MLKILKVMANDNLVSLEVTQEIANAIVDENYNYDIEGDYIIPDVLSHSAEVLEPMKANFLLNKNTTQNINSNSDTIPAKHLYNMLFN